MSFEHLKGKFITFEGVEGAGKTTQSKMLVEYLNQRGISAVWTREPGGCDAAEEIRKLLLSGSINNWDSTTELLLLFAARRMHTEKKIKPLLAENKVVVSDRYLDSTIAYQGYGQGVDLDKIAKIQEIVLDDFRPDITIILDLDIEVGLERANKRGETNRYEDMELEFHKRVRNGFLNVFNRQESRTRLLDVSSKDVDTVFSEILNLLSLYQ